MKIEMGESLVYSWLRHYRNCQVCQLNWKASEVWNCDSSDIVYCQELMNELLSAFDNPFKKTKNVQQLLKQCEIDVIGIDTFNSSFFAIDVAYHSNGLGYKNPVEQVTMKILRAVLISLVYFKNFENYFICFVSPKVSNQLDNELNQRIEKINQFLIHKDIKNIRCDFISNDRFKDEILLPVVKNSSEISDTSELFLRSYQLLKIFDNKVLSKYIETDNFEKQPQDMNNETIRIGEFVQKEFRDLLENDLLTSEMLGNLQDPDYCRTTFKMNYPILKRVINQQDIKREILINKHPRYYAKPIGNFLLCNNWFEYHRSSVLQWILMVKK